MSLSLSQRLVHPGKRLWSKAKDLMDEARPPRPAKELFAQGQSFEDFLLLEDSFEWPFMGMEEHFTVFLMRDGALGVGLWLTPMASEMLDEAELAQRLETLAELFSKIKNPNASLQILFDAEPDFSTDSAFDLKEPSSKSNEESPSFATSIAQTRYEFLSQFATKPKHEIRLMKRRILLTLRVSGEHPLLDTGVFQGKEAEATEKNLIARLSSLRDILTKLKGGVLAAQFRLHILKREECLVFFRDTLHSFHMRKTSRFRHQSASKANRSLSQQVLYHFAHMTPFGVGLGEGKSADVWQVASLLELPETTTFGMMSKLLKIKSAHRVVVQFRPVLKTNDLDRNRYLLKNAEDAYGVRQFEDITATQVRLNQEEALLAFSLHLLVRNENKTLCDLENDGSLRGILSEVGPLLSGQFVEETLCAPLVFASTLPFQNSKEICALVGRESRVLARNLVALLPLYGGFQGTLTPMVQMISRGGERIHLNPRDSHGASHLAVLGGSGAGKSFAMANLILSFMATHPKGRVFLIDKKTSYATLAYLSSEEKNRGGCSYFRPPHNFPNIFAGFLSQDRILDEDRLPSLVNLLGTAIALLSPKADLTAMHTRVLSDALRRTFEEKSRQSVSVFDEVTGRVIAKECTQVLLPRLSEVVSHLPAACDALQFAPQIAIALAENLSPFMGGGPYAKFFDVAAVEEVSPVIPLLTLCDLDGVSGDPVLQVLTTQVLILEILRLVKPKCDAQGNVIPNPPSLLILEEVGVLASESPALVSFIRDAWKTMRKYDVTCVGVTNEVSDYTEKPGPKEVWNVSPNKLILTQNSSAIGEMETKIKEGKNGLVPSLYHCEILRSLKMQKGEFSEALWMGDTTQGTYVYIPTGFDYWCAASNPIELVTLRRVTEAFGKRSIECVNPYFKAVSLLAQNFPQGIRSSHGELKELSEEELCELVSQDVALSKREVSP